MNLLSYKNRFQTSNLVPVNVDKVNGYREALEDIICYLRDKTDYNPDKRYIDSVGLLESISETSEDIVKLYERAEIEIKGSFRELAGVDLGSDKVNQFLKEQTTDPNDLKDVL